MTRRHRWTTALACMAYFLAIADGLGMTAALHPVARSFHASSGALRGVVGAFLVAAALVLPVGAQAADRFGPKRTLTAAWAVYALGSVAGAVVPSAGWLTAARAVQGVGIAVAAAGARRLNDRSAPDDAAASATKFSASSSATRLACALAIVTAPLIVGAWTAGPGWRWYFAADAALAVAAALATVVCTDEAAREPRRLDLEGLVASSAGLVALVWALGRTGSVGWRTPGEIAALTVGIASLALVVKWLVPVGPRYQRLFLATNAAELLFYASLAGPIYAVSWELRPADAAGALATGLRLTMWTAVAAWPLAFRNPSRITVFPRALRCVGLAMHGAGLTALAWLAAGDVRRPAAIAPLLLSALGVGLALGVRRGAPSSGGGRSNPSGDRAPATTVVGAVSLIGAVLGVVYPGAVFPSFDAAGSGDARTDALVSVLRWAALLAAIAAAVSLAVPARAPGFRPVPETDPPDPRRPRGDSDRADGPWGPARGVERARTRTVVRLGSAGLSGGVPVETPSAVPAGRDVPVGSLELQVRGAAVRPAQRRTAGARLRLVEPLREAVVPQQAEAPGQESVEAGDVPWARPVLTLVPRGE